MESLDSVGRPKPRSRASLDRSLDYDDDKAQTRSAGRAAVPQVAVKPARKPQHQRTAAAAGGDETDV